MSTLELYERLKPRLGETESRALLEHIDGVQKASVTEERFEKELTHLATKADLAELKASLMRWMFALWATQMLAIIALFLRK